MAHRTFYFLNEAQLEVPSTSPVEMSASELIEQLLPLVSHEDDFIGLLDESDNHLQISVSEQARHYVVELPDPVQRCSFRREMSLGELIELLHRLPGELIPGRFPGFEPARW